MEKSCVFCSIVADEEKSEIIGRGDGCIAIKDLFPVAKIHILIIPREHLLYLSDLDKQNMFVVKCMYELAVEIAKGYGLDQSGYRLVINQKNHAGQQVPHLHLHLIGGETLGVMA